jgi:hypothetical protein
MNPNGMHTITAIALILTLAILQPEQFAAGQPSTGVNDTLCDSNVSSTLVAGAVEKAAGDFFVECASNNLIIFSFPEANSKWGFSAVDHIISNSNYTIDDVTTSGIGREASVRVIMSSK